MKPEEVAAGETGSQTYLLQLSETFQYLQQLTHPESDYPDIR